MAGDVAASQAIRPWVWGGLAALLGLLSLLLLLPREREIHRSDGLFGDVRVVESGSGVRALYFGDSRNRQTALHPDRPLRLELPYTRVAMVGPALAPDTGRILFVGLGGGALPRATRALRPGVEIHVVEIDPVVVAVAERYFGFSPDPAMTVHVEDGRAFLERGGMGMWDLILLDAFSDQGIPQALATLEFLETVRARLAPGGVVVSNVPTRHPTSNAMLATYLEVFPQVHTVDVPRRRQAILVAGVGDRALSREELVAAAEASDFSERLGFDLPRLVREGYGGRPRTTAPVLRDPVLGDPATEIPTGFPGEGPGAPT